MLTDYSRCTVRPMTSGGIDAVATYWFRAAPDDLERMGVDFAAFPPEAHYRAGLAQALTVPEDQVKAFVLVWDVDGKSVGFSSLKDIVRGEHGSMHLHMWDAGLRGKGYGARLFCLAALDFYERFQLQRIICEPKAANPMPNRMLQKIGFPLLFTREGVSSELSAVTTLNRYDVRRDVAAEFLAAR